MKLEKIPAAPPADQQAAAAVEPDELARLEAQEQADAVPPPAGAAATPAEPSISTSDLIVMVGGPWFDILAPNWKVGEQEKKQLGDAYGELIDKYFPDWEKRFGPELACVVVTAAVFGPRIAMKMPPRLPAKKPEGEAASAGAKQET